MAVKVPLELEVKSLIQGKKVPELQQPASRPAYDVSSFPGSENGRLIYRSILTRGNGERIFADNPLEYKGGKLPRDGLRFVMLPLYKLYQTAYFGTWSVPDLMKENIYPEVILLCKDSVLFKFNHAAPDFKGLYNFNLAIDSIHSHSIEYFKKVFQRELDNAFGFNIRIEKRKMPVLKMITLNNSVAKLKTTGKMYNRENVLFDMKFINHSIVQLTDAIWTYYQHEPPIFDETGITYNIDIKLNGSIMDMNDLRRSLQKNGLDIVKGEREMTVLVIEDPMEP